MITSNVSVTLVCMTRVVNNNNNNARINMEKTWNTKMNMMIMLTISKMIIVISMMIIMILTNMLMILTRKGKTYPSTNNSRNQKRKIKKYHVSNVEALVIWRKIVKSKYSVNIARKLVICKRIVLKRMGIQKSHLADSLNYH